MDRKLFTLIEIVLIGALILAVLYMGGVFERPTSPTPSPVSTARVVVLEPTAGLPRPSPTATPPPTHPPLTRPAGLIAFESTRNGDHEIYRVDVEDDRQGEPVNLTRHPSDDYLLAWSPDGRYIVFLSTRTGWLEVYRMDSDGANVIRLTDTQSTNTAYTAVAAWSPDGQSLLAMRTTPWAVNDEPRPWMLDRIRTDGSGAVTLFQGENSWLGQAGISDDGTYAAVNILSESRLGLYTAPMEPDALALRQIADGCSRFDWQPRTRSLVCSSGDTLFKINADGTGRSGPPITDMASAIARDMAWSPDGSQLLIVYESYEPGGIPNRLLSLVSWDEGKISRQTLLSGLDIVGGASWAPDSQWAAFAYRDDSGERVVGIFNIYNPLDGPRLTDSGDSFNPRWQP